MDVRALQHFRSIVQHRNLRRAAAELGVTQPALSQSIRRLEAEHPELHDPSSPTQRVGAPPSDKFRKVRHLQAMGSLDKVTTEDDLRKWADDIRRLLTMAPERTDVIIPYVSWLMLKGDKAEAFDAMTKLSPLVMPGDPVGDWLEARRAELNGDASTHRARMAKALRGGIANLIRLRRADTEVFLGAHAVGSSEATGEPAR